VSLLFDHEDESRYVPSKRPILCVLQRYNAEDGIIQLSLYYCVLRTCTLQLGGYASCTATI
jgi:hypothetical protein